MSDDVKTTNPPTLTKRQAEAVAVLRRLPPGHWQEWGSGMGRYNVALRGLLYRCPDFLCCVVDSDGKEKWRLS
jgi:hypothetical protein